MNSKDRLAQIENQFFSNTKFTLIPQRVSVTDGETQIHFLFLSIHYS